MLSVITVTYNSRDEIERFLDSLSETKKRLNLSMETIVWDNASTDGTREFLATKKGLKSQGLHIEFSSKNVGLSRAANAAIAKSRGDFILHCNPDVEFSDDLQKLLEFASSHPEFGVVPDLINTDGTIQRSIHRRFPNFTRIFFEYTTVGIYVSRIIPFVRTDYKYLDTSFASRAIVEQPGWSFLLISRKTLDRLSERGKLFDEQFPVFWNDVDVSMRARAKGLKFVILPDAQIVHGYGRSVGKVNREILLTLYFGRHGLVGFASKWRMHPRAIQIIFLLDSVFAVFLGFFARFAKSRSRTPVADFRWRITKFWCSIH